MKKICSESFLGRGCHKLDMGVIIAGCHWFVRKYSSWNILDGGCHNVDTGCHKLDRGSHK